MSVKNIWEIAVEQFKESERESKETKDSVLLLLGSKKGGKSTICYKFLERTETAKPTLALEYLFGRRNKGLESGKDICHIWELGGGTLFMDLLEIPITQENLLTLSVALVLDLSKPNEMWSVIQNLLSGVQKHIDDVLTKSKNPALKKSLQELSQSRVPPTHEDYKLIDPFPVPLLIMASKYDLFQTEDVQKRKLLCKCLRYIAHLRAASLMFVSSRSETLISKSRVSISAMVFGTSQSKTTISDHNKPIYVCAGADSFQAIGPLSNLQVENKSGPRSIEALKSIFCSHFPQSESKNVIPEDPAEDSNFKEPDIDNMRAQKKRELQEYKKKLQQKSIHRFN